MSEPWFDALERLDVTLEDAGTMFELVARLADILDRPPSILQIDAAAQRFQFQLGQLQQAALTQGQQIDRFQVQGRTVFQLRDSLGRFVSRGVSNITERLGRGAG